MLIELTFLLPLFQKKTRLRRAVSLGFGFYACRCEILGDHQNPSISQISVKHLQVCVLRIDSGPLAGSGAS